MRKIGLVLIIVAALGSIFQSARAQSDSARVLVIEAEGPITPPMYEYIRRAVKAAEGRAAEALVIELNTPGGSLDTTVDIITVMRGSTVPVIVFITPNGGMAGSAGAIITMAAHASAMSPETAIGAASPISGTGEDLNETLEAKAKEIMRAQIRPLVEPRGQEAVDLAQAMIEEAKAATAQEALDVHLIDFIANDTSDLLDKLDGFAVTVGGESRTLRTANAETEAFDMSFIERFLLMLTDPNITFLLLAIGVQAILIEISSPGGWVAGFIGVVCLSLAIYGAGVLPVNWFGMIFLATAFVLFVLDVKAPTHGALTAAGVASFIVGALVLFNSPGTPQFQRVSVPLVISVGIILGLGFFIIVGFAIRAQRAPIRMGVEALPGRVGTARTDVEQSGQIQVGAELWSAEAADGTAPIKKGDRVEVVSVEGLRLRVRKQ